MMENNVNIITLSEYIPGKASLNVRCLCATEDTQKAIGVYEQQKYRLRQHIETGHPGDITEDEYEVNDNETLFSLSKEGHLIVMRFTKTQLRR